MPETTPSTKPDAEPEAPAPEAPEAASVPPADEAPAAAPEGPSGSQSGRDRLVSAMRRPGKGQVVVAVLLALVGFAFVVQVEDNDRDDVYEGLRETELIEVLDGLTGTAERARREVDRLESRRDELQTEASARDAALDEAEQRARSLNILAGLVPVTGPGVRVTIEETDGRVSVGSLLDMVQEMRTAGAEAMEFNDQYRVTAESSFDNGVGGIELDGQLLEPPYVLEVIGDPHALRGGLEFPSGPVETLEEFDGATVTIEELESIDITSVREPDRPEHAEPDDDQ